MRWIASFALALPALLPALLGGRAAAEDPPPTLDTIVVEGDRFDDERTRSEDEAREVLEEAPAGVALVDEREIRETRAVGFEDLLGFVPGVLARSVGAAEEPKLSIRGSGLRNNFHVRGVNLYLDGVIFNNADGFAEVEAFEMLAARRLEIHKGAQSPRYSGGALGGAIDVVTRTGKDEPLVGVRSQGGSWDFYKLFASGAAQRGPWDGYLAFSQTDEDGWREHASNGRQRLFASLGRELPAGASLRGDLQLVRNRANLPGDLTPAEFRDDPSQADPASLALGAQRDFDFARGAWSLRVPFSESTAVEWTGQASYQSQFHPLPFGVIQSRTTNLASEIRLVGAGSVLSRPNQVTVGLLVAGTRQPQTISQNLAGRPGADESDLTAWAGNAALWIADDFAILDDLSLVLGGRGQLSGRRVEDEIGSDTDSASYHSLTPTLGLLWRPLPELQVYASASRGYEPPLILELTSAGNLENDLDHLDAQRAWQFELGTRGRLGERVRFELAVFDWELRDELRNVNTQPFPGAPFTLPGYVNIPRSRHTGVELGGTLALARDLAPRLGLPGEDLLELIAAYTWSRFRFVDDAEFGDNQLAGAFEHVAAAQLRYRHACGFWIAPGFLYTGASFEDSANTRRISDYAVWDLAFGYDHEPSGLGFTLELRNLTDRRYVESVSVDTEGDRYIRPGTARAVYGSLTWSWR